MPTDCALRTSLLSGRQVIWSFILPLATPLTLAVYRTMQSDNVTSELRNGHGDGHTDVAFIPDGSALLTAGSDGECRLWLKEDDFQDCESFPVGSTVYAVAVHVSS